MENAFTPPHIVVVYDATKDRGVHELGRTFEEVLMRGDILNRGHKLIVLGVLHKVPNPMGYMKACTDSFGGTTKSIMEEEMSKRLEAYVNMLQQCSEACEEKRVTMDVTIEVKITAGTPMKQVILQEIASLNAAWAILDRHLRRDLRFYLKQIPCKVALIQDNFSVKIERTNYNTETDPVEHKSLCSMSKIVPFSNFQSGEHDGQSVISCRSGPPISSFESSDISRSNSSYGSREHNPVDYGTAAKHHKSDIYDKSEDKKIAQQRSPPRRKSSEAPLLCSTCGQRTEFYVKDSIQFRFSDVQLATNNFSQNNLLGEGGYGHVYKGELRDGQLIAAKVRKEASTQGFREFQSEVHVLNFARHKNIVMLLGFCCKENLNILVYEYICNKSLDWHLFGKAANSLDWHQRYYIATGTAKGLRFLHEECRGCPVIHRDVRPGNILLTHDFVPMLGDFGLARWKTTDEVQTRVLGTLGYLAPEYAENGVVSVRTDVYSFGIILLQLISGQKVVDSTREEGQRSLRQWAEPLIEKLALHELIDQRIGDSYDTYELYLMAKAAYLCIQRSPEMRPSMGEVVRLLEGENSHLNRLQEQVLPRYRGT